VRWTKIVWVLLLTAYRPVLAQDTFEISDYIDSTAAILAPELQGAVASLESGDPVAAAVELRDILSRNPEQGQAWRLLASAYLRLDDFAQAIDACRQLAAIDSSDAGILVALGYLHQRLGDIASAEQYYRQGLVLDPNAVTAYQGLGWVYLKTGRLEQALDMVSETTERAPNYAPNYVLMGRALTAQGFFKDAAIAYNRAFALQNDLRERYGILLQELGLRHRLRR
jgi:tetratricopeptide (TPR) repeat protein